MIDRRTWRQFQEAGLIWWINRALHLFGWAIVMEVKPDGEVLDVYPARCSFRGFSAEDEAEGFAKVTRQLAEDAPTLLRQAGE